MRCDELRLAATRGACRFGGIDRARSRASYASRAGKMRSHDTTVRSDLEFRCSGTSSRLQAPCAARMARHRVHLRNDRPPTASMYRLYSALRNTEPACFPVDPACSALCTFCSCLQRVALYFGPFSLYSAAQIFFDREQNRVRPKRAERQRRNTTFQGRRSKRRGLRRTVECGRAYTASLRKSGTASCSTR